MNRLSEHYKNVIVNELMTIFHYKNIYQIPRINKILLNISLKDSINNKNKILLTLLLIEKITGQKGIPTKSNKNKIFLRIKKGAIVGCKITLRKYNMFTFLDKLILSVFPKIKNFTSFQLNTKNINIFNFNIYKKDIFNFLEIEKEFLKFKDIPLINISIQSNAKTRMELFYLLFFFNFPIKY